MLRVGLTGGIGAGKSAVAARLAARGAVVVDADAVAREVVATGTPGLAAVVVAFGAGVLASDGALDRPALGRIVFVDAEARRRLEAITHPLIGRRSAELIAAAEASGARVLVHDVPLLVEGGLAGAYDTVVVVQAPLPLRLQRLRERGLPEEEARSRIAHQASDEERRAVATYVVDNAGDLAGLDRRVDLLWQALIVGHDPTLVELPASKGEMKRLGGRLAGPASRADDALLAQWLVAHDEVRRRTEARLRAAVDQPVRGRVKTRDTLLAKLEREPGVDLSNVQDLAGVRVVVAGGRDDQDRVVERVRRLLTAPGRPARVADRRLLGRDSNGYRAVHVVGRVGGLQVEVQVRTALQHQWAELSEKLADQWGRQMRYGHPPDDAGSEQVGDVRRKWATFVREVADWVQEAETSRQRSHDRVTALEQDEQRLLVDRQYVDALSTEVRHSPQGRALMQAVLQMEGLLERQRQAHQELSTAEQKAQEWLVASLSALATRLLE